MGWVLDGAEVDAEDDAVDELAEPDVVEVVATLEPGVALHTVVPALAALVSAASVCGPIWPSTVKPELAWKLRMAASVSPPSIPSTGPASHPTLFRSVCHFFSSSLDAADVRLPPEPADVPGVLVAGVVVPVVLALLLLLLHYCGSNYNAHIIH